MGTYTAYMHGQIIRAFIKLLPDETLKNVIDYLEGNDDVGAAEYLEEWIKVFKDGEL